MLGRKSDLPPFVVLPELMGRGGGNLPNGQAGGFLGKAHDPFALNADPSQKNLFYWSAECRFREASPLIKPTRGGVGLRLGENKRLKEAKRG